MWFVKVSTLDSTQHIAGVWGIEGFHWKRDIRKRGRNLWETGILEVTDREDHLRRPSAGGVLTPRLEPLPIASKDQEVCLGQCPHHKDCHLYFLLRASPSWVHMVTDITCYDFCKFFQIRQFLSSEVLVGVLNLSELGKIWNAAILVFLLLTASLVCWA